MNKEYILSILYAIILSEIKFSYDLIKFITLYLSIQLIRKLMDFNYMQLAIMTHKDTDFQNAFETLVHILHYKHLYHLHNSNLHLLQHLEYEDAKEIVSMIIT